MKYKIQELGRVITGSTPKTVCKEYYATNDKKYLFITPTDLKGEKKILKTQRYVSNLAYQDYEKKFAENFIGVSCIGSDMGKVFISPNKAMTNQQINIITNINENDFSIDYLYYKLSEMKNIFQNLSSGSAMPNLSKSQFENIEVEIPSLSEQKCIADILTSLDDKIELNNQMNQTLEEMAKVLYKQWFVDFEFPNEDGKPYKSSGGEMVESELGLIPKGWKIDSLGSIGEIFSGKRPRIKSDIKCVENNIPIIGASKIMGYTNEYMFEEDNNLLIVGRVGTLGVVQEYQEKIWLSDNTLILKSNTQNYLKQLIQTIDFQALNSGSTQPLITQTTLNNVKVTLPKEEFLREYEQIVSKFKQKKYGLLRETHTLEKTKKILLERFF